MIYKIIIEEKALKDLKYFSRNKKDILDKIDHLLCDLENHPFDGIGKPEPLRFELSGYWSKRITKEHRMVYEVKNKTITIFSFRFHY